MPKETEERIINPLYILIWLGVSLWVGVNHEPFADEAQAYLIARDATVWDILTTVSRTEGTPALWYLWLKFLMYCGFDYSKLYMASIFPNLLAVYLFISKAPFSKYIKYLFPLTYFILYQYNIVSRNYGLLFLMTTVAAICYENRHRHPYRLILSLLLLGSVSSHAFILSCSIVVFWIYKEADKEEGLKGYRIFIEKNLKALSIFAIFIICTIVYLYPESSNQYLYNYELLEGYRIRNILTLMSVGLISSSEIAPENLGYIYIGLGYFLLMMYMMSKKYRMSFGILFLPNLLFMLFVPYKPWHAGIIIMSGMFLFWQERREISRSVQIGVGILLCVQIIWSCMGIIKDIRGKYSVTKDIHNFLQTENISASETKIAAFNGISLYLYEKEGNFSYWDWRYNGFTQRITPKDIKQNRAIIINKEVYDKFNPRIKEIEAQGNYQIKSFISDHFFALQDMSKDETLYVLYRK